MKQTSDITFSPDWLALREPADHAARDPDLLARAAQSVAPGTCVLDLGSGTGSTLRAFAHHGHADLKWRLYDNDPNLLGLATHRHPNAQGVVGDLGDVDALSFEGVGLVTASALLDLMSLDWVTALAKHLRAASLPFYAALNYDGVMNWTPADPDDKVVTDVFIAHQQRDKGVGAALGPRSAPMAARVFDDCGFDVALADSPWTVGPDQAELHRQLVDGIADAVGEMDDTAAPNWRATRKAAATQSTAHIGHIDLLAIPRQTRT